MDRIGNSLKELLERLQLSQPLENWKAVELWPTVAGPQVAPHSRATAVRNGVLQVEVESFSWATELTYRKHQFVALFAEHLGSNEIRDIRFTAAPAQTPGAKPQERA